MLEHGPLFNNYFCWLVLEKHFARYEMEWLEYINSIKYFLYNNGWLLTGRTSTARSRMLEKCLKLSFARFILCLYTIFPQGFCWIYWET